ncbi:hypothetical protein FRUB_01775 [Fimbriiglobus ruber]|uniref:Uncharacterized protein n=1 Tax=Fimbriiglobus ruber TaxID=1908690 RepID=A0A225E0V7_9BACT|nr:hypothetical protein FRUB_01775 [Fimbriiglobus ruber]
MSAAVSGLSARPETAQPFAATRAMSRFRNHPGIPVHALREPAHDAICTARTRMSANRAPVVHGGCRFRFNTHTS